MKKNIFSIIVIAVVVILSCNMWGLTVGASTTNQSQQLQKIQQVTQWVSKDLNTYLQNSESLPYRITYTIKSGLNDQVFVFEVVEYNSNGKKRTDTFSNGKELRLYMDENTVYQCSKSNEWRCYNVAQDSGMETGTVDTNKYEILDLPDRQIAGATAKCFEVNVRGRWIYCFSPEGVPLYTLSNSTSGFSEKNASKYSTQIDDSIFELPSTPIVAEGVELMIPYANCQPL